MFSKINEAALDLLVRAQAGARREDGVTALEYIAGAVAVVFLVGLGFRLLGTDIMEKASTLVDNIIAPFE
jgi:Flp pilus assembly pilin Flp